MSRWNVEELQKTSWFGPLLEQIRQELELVSAEPAPRQRWNVEELQKTSWFGPLLEQIRQELELVSAEQHDARPALEKERNQLGEQIQGWSLSLAKPGLNPSVRCVLEEDMERALARQQAVERQLTEIDAMGRQAGVVVNPQQVVDRLNRLAEVLATGNPTRGNLELSLHIDAIRCYRDARVVVRTCKLGALAGATDLFAQPDEVSPAAPSGPGEAMTAKPRRRAVRRVGDGDGDQGELHAAAHAAAAVDRFAGLGAEWFWEDTFSIPPRTFWSDEHAQEVARLRRETGWPLTKLAEHFGRSIPTIRLALKKAGNDEPREPGGHDPEG